MYLGVASNVIGERQCDFKQMPSKVKITMNSESEVDSDNNEGSIENTPDQQENKKEAEDNVPQGNGDEDDEDEASSEDIAEENEEEEADIDDESEDEDISNESDEYLNLTEEIYTSNIAQHIDKSSVIMMLNNALKQLGMVQITSRDIPEMNQCPNIADSKLHSSWRTEPPLYFGEKDRRIAPIQIQHFLEDVFGQDNFIFKKSSLLEMNEAFHHENHVFFFAQAILNRKTRDADTALPIPQVKDKVSERQIQ